ncbi:acyl carrier protein [Streptomyces albogriseolus]|jgi:act minimal PKS acyl carrier protein|uniref:Acyl carrier protein n=2 Tax=Streptomyces albogriseolus group TaxID=2867120 RepID=A0ABP6TG94_9ACTN|nr:MULTISPECIES: acyl carrier protein [Streptomyces]GHC21266.1 actinorhodin polyketide synthase acyl carrier protein [Streptomyces albogriseolus]MCX4571350.1 acyl carrier protein [Streptomyces viridodiastaticus]MCX4624850.1 acyl carrier protein [Streptomyces viridodiastaticus]NIL52612.1 acyl carrier protein [Streptomyces sp. 2BBP-J2]GHG32386.1 actinorhodin polyketide synthase acyl carrier protein [Streptomyces viridodiastaticus]
MRQFELDDLKALLRECAGEEEGVDLDGDVVDVPFAELGYDSLAILQTTGRIERDFDVALDEEALDEADTPRAYLELVNRALAAVRTAA